MRLSPKQTKRLYRLFIVFFDAVMLGKEIDRQDVVEAQAFIADVDNRIPPDYPPVFLDDIVDGIMPRDVMRNIFKK